MNRPAILPLFIILFSFSGSIFASQTRFLNYKSSDYDGQIAALSVSDLACFPNGKCFQILSKGADNHTSKTFAISPTEAIRVPMGADLRNRNVNISFANGYSELAEKGVQVIGVDLSASSPGDYVVIDRIPHRMNLNEYLAIRKHISEIDRNKWDFALIDFARSTWAFSDIGNLTPEQIAFDGTRWVLVNWLENHSQVRGLDEGTVFSNGHIRLPEDLQPRVEKAIRNERIRQGLRNGGPRTHFINYGSPNYEETVQSVAAGDTICFWNQHCFEVQSILGEGDTTKVFAISDRQAIRVPLVNKKHSTKFGTFAEINASYAHGYSVLHDRGVSVVGVDLDGSSPGNYVLVERVPIQMDLQDYLIKRNILSGVEREPYDKALIAFARSTWAFASLGDMHTLQIVYDGKKWVLLDWIDEHRLANDLEDGTIFWKSKLEHQVDEVFVKGGQPIAVADKIDLPQDLIEPVANAIREERVRHGVAPKVSCMGFLLGEVKSAAMKFFLPPKMPPR